MRITAIVTLKTLLFAAIFSLTAFAANAQTQKGADIDGVWIGGDESGFSVSMADSHTLAIGACNNDGNGTNAGHVRVYSWNGNSWGQKGNDINGESSGDGSGYSICMPNANTVAIGAPQNDGNGVNSGHVRIYSWNGSSWVQKGTDINGEAPNDRSGHSLSMPNGNTIAIGAPGNDGNGNSSGHVRVYFWDGTVWKQKGIDINGDASDNASGSSVSMPDSNTLAIGAPQNDGNGTDAGLVRIYRWNGIAWIQFGSGFSGKSAYDQFGLSVSMPDVNTLAIGGPYNDGNGADAGHVRIYTWNGSNWLQKGTDIYGNAFDNSGFSVSMPEANIIAIGAPYSDGNGQDAGRVRIYQWNGSNWKQKGKDVNGEAFLDLSGTSVSMADVYNLAIGAPYNDGSGQNAGHVRVYFLCKNTNAGITRSACDYYTSPSGKYTWRNSGTYDDTILNVLGCDSIIKINLTINTVDISLINSSPTLTAKATGAIYQWLDCNNGFAAIGGANNQSFMATANGSYAVKVTQNGCTDTSLCINVSNANILENSFGNSLKIFPNPTHGETSIELGANYNDVSVIVRNAIGQEVMRKSYSSANSLQINIPGEAGIYMVEVTAQDKKAILKVVKK